MIRELKGLLFNRALLQNGGEAIRFLLLLLSELEFSAVEVVPERIQICIFFLIEDELTLDRWFLVLSLCISFLIFLNNCIYFLKINFVLQLDLNTELFKLQHFISELIILLYQLTSFLLLLLYLPYQILYHGILSYQLLFLLIVGNDILFALLHELLMNLFDLHELIHDQFEVGVLFLQLNVFLDDV